MKVTLRKPQSILALLLKKNKKTVLHFCVYQRGGGTFPKVMALGVLPTVSVAGGSIQKSKSVSSICAVKHRQHTTCRKKTKAVSQIPQQKQKQRQNPMRPSYHTKLSKNFSPPPAWQIWRGIGNSALEKVFAYIAIKPDRPLKNGHSEIRMCLLVLCERKGGLFSFICAISLISRKICNLNLRKRHNMNAPMIDARFAINMN